MQKLQQTYYKVYLPLLKSSQISNEDQNIYYKCFYFANDTKFPHYQVKYWEMLGFHFYDKMSQDKAKFMSQIKQIAKQVDSIQDVSDGLCPKMKNLHPCEMNILEKKLMKNYKNQQQSKDITPHKLYLNGLYGLGKIMEQKGQFQMAYKFYSEGAGIASSNQNFKIDQGCGIKMMEICCEPNLANKFGIKVDHGQAVKHFLRNIQTNGIFSRLTQKPKDQMTTLHSFYILIDCFQAFQSFILQHISKEESKKNIQPAQQIENLLLKFFLSLKLEKNPEYHDIVTVIEDFQTFAQTAKGNEQLVDKYDILLGDLMNPFFLGISLESEFNVIQGRYKNCLKYNQHLGLNRLASINQILISQLIQKKRIQQLEISSPQSEMQQAGLMTPLANIKRDDVKEDLAMQKIMKNYQLCIDKMNKLEELKTNEETLQNLSLTCELFIPFMEEPNVQSPERSNKRKKTESSKIVIKRQQTSNKSLEEATNQNMLQCLRELCQIGSQHSLLEHFLLLKLYFSKLKQVDVISNLQIINDIKNEMLLIAMKLQHKTYQLNRESEDTSKFIYGLSMSSYCMQKGVGIQKNDLEALKQHSQIISALMQRQLDYSTPCYYIAQILKKDSEFQQHSLLFYELFYYRLITNLSKDSSNYLSFLSLIKLYRYGFLEQNLQYSYDMVLALQEHLDKIQNKSLFQRVISSLLDNLLLKIQKQAFNQNITVGHLEGHNVVKYEQVIQLEFGLFKKQFIHMSLYEKRLKGNMGDQTNAIIAQAIGKYQRIYQKTDCYLKQHVEKLYQELGEKEEIEYKNVKFNKITSKSAPSYYNQQNQEEEDNQANENDVSEKSINNNTYNSTMFRFRDATDTKYKVKVEVELLRPDSHYNFNYEKFMLARVDEVCQYYTHRLKAKTHVFSEAEVSILQSCSDDNDLSPQLGLVITVTEQAQLCLTENTDRQQEELQQQANVMKNKPQKGQTIINLTKDVAFAKCVFAKNNQISYMHSTNFHITKQGYHMQQFFEKLEEFCEMNQSNCMLSLYGVCLVKKGADNVEIRQFYEPFDANYSSYVQQEMLTNNNSTVNDKIKMVSRLLHLVQSIYNSQNLIYLISPNNLCFRTNSPLTPKFIDPTFLTISLNKQQGNQQITKTHEFAQQLLTHSAHYCAPEIISQVFSKENVVLSHGSALWGIGIMLFELILPETNSQLTELHKAIESQNVQQFKQVYNQLRFTAKINDAQQSNSILDQQKSNEEVYSLLQKLLRVSQTERTKQIFFEMQSTINKHLSLEDYESYGSDLLNNAFLNARWNYNENENQIEQNENSNQKQRVVYLPNGFLFTGQLTKGLPFGQGCLTKNDESVMYSGKFYNGRFNGDNGLYKNLRRNFEFFGSFTDHSPILGEVRDIGSTNAANQAQIQVQQNLIDHHTSVQVQYEMPNPKSLMQVIKLDIAEKMLYESSFEVHSQFLHFPDQMDEKGKTGGQILKLGMLASYMKTFELEFNKQTFLFRQTDLYGNTVYSQSQFSGQTTASASQTEREIFVICNNSYHSSHFIMYDSKISNEYLFFMDASQYGMFIRDRKQELQVGPISIVNCNLIGQMIHHFGVRGYGMFNNFYHIKGMKCWGFDLPKCITAEEKNIKSYYQTIDVKSIIHAGEFKYGASRNYKGQIIKDKAHGYGEEVVNQAFYFKGQFRNMLAQGHGMLSGVDGTMYFKAFFDHGQPCWGTLFKGKEFKYEGKFIHKNTQMTIYNIKNIAQIFENISVEGWCHTANEKIVAKWGMFKSLEDHTLTGYFKLKFKTGNYFEGYLIDGVRRGKGQQYIKVKEGDYIIMFGTWNNQKLKGRIQYEQEHQYDIGIGEFRLFDNMTISIDGFCIMHFKKKDKVYEGTFYDNLMHGFGELMYVKSKTEGNTKAQLSKTKSYVGEFSKGKKQGYGIQMESAPHTTYRGNFIDSKKSGFGSIYLQKHKYIDGMWEDNKLLYAIVYPKNHQVIDKIECSNLLYNESTNEYEAIGFGTIFLRNQHKIECDMKNVLKEVQNQTFSKRVGIIYLGNKYEFMEGVIENYQLNGYGTHLKNGFLIYEGHFVNGKYNGIGIEYMQDTNQTYRGLFENGCREGLGELISENQANSQSTIGYWHLGQKNGIHDLKYFEQGQEQHLQINCQENQIYSAVLNI